MTQQLSARQSPPAAAGAADEGLDFRIVDETPAEQVEQESRLLAGHPQDAPQPEPQAPRQPRADAGEPGPAAQQPVPGERPRTGRAYSQEEVSRMQSAWARQIGEARKSAAEASERLEKFNLDAAVEAALRRQEGELAGRVGKDEARSQARSPQNEQFVRQSIAGQQQLLAAEVARHRAATRQEQQAKFIVARTLMQENGLAPDDFETLSAVSSPRAMVRLARRLGGLGGAPMRSRVPAETPETQLENGLYAGPAPEDSDRRLQRIAARPSWEWTDADLRYMQTGELR